MLAYSSSFSHLFYLYFITKAFSFFFPFLFIDILSTPLHNPTMASSRALIVFSHTLFIVLLNGYWGETATPVAAPSPSSSLPPADCMSELLSLSGCLPFVQAGSTVVKPDASCCSSLKKAVKEKPVCLCQAFGSSSTFGFSLNMTKAISLPSACNIKTNPIAKCKLVGAPLGAPVLAPKASSEITPSAGFSQAPSPTLASSAAFFFPIPFNVLFVYFTSFVVLFP